MRTLTIVACLSIIATSDLKARAQYDVQTQLENRQKEVEELKKENAALNNKIKFLEREMNSFRNLTVNRQRNSRKSTTRKDSVEVDYTNPVNIWKDVVRQLNQHAKQVAKKGNVAGRH